MVLVKGTRGSARCVLPRDIGQWCLTRIAYISFLESELSSLTQRTTLCVVQSLWVARRTGQLCLCRGGARLGLSVQCNIISREVCTFRRGPASSCRSQGLTIHSTDTNIFHHPRWLLSRHLMGGSGISHIAIKVSIYTYTCLVGVSWTDKVQRKGIFLEPATVETLLLHQANWIGPARSPTAG